MPIVKIGPAKMDQLARLILYRGNDLRMAVARRTYGDAGVTVQKHISIGVSDPNTFSVVSNQLIVRPRIARRYILCIGIYYFEDNNQAGQPKD